MMLPIDQTDHAEAKRPDSTEPFRPGGILLLGYLRKLKVIALLSTWIYFTWYSFLPVLIPQRMKKKYFILFADSESLPARLEYFDSEKKWKNGQTAKRWEPFVFSCGDCCSTYSIVLPIQVHRSQVVLQHKQKTGLQAQVCDWPLHQRRLFSNCLWLGRRTDQVVHHPAENSAVWQSLWRRRAQTYLR